MKRLETAAAWLLGILWILPLLYAFWTAFHPPEYSTRFALAALQSIPPSLGEAAAIEGASRAYYFRRVVFPLLMPTTLFVLVNAIINSFRLVDHIVVMTRGGPNNATSLLLFHIYQVGFSFWDTGYAAALTMVLLAILAATAIAQFVFLDRRVHYQ